MSFIETMTRKLQFEKWAKIPNLGQNVIIKQLTSLTTNNIYNFYSLNIIKFVAFQKILTPMDLCNVNHTQKKKVTLIFSPISILQEKFEKFWQNMGS